MKYKVVKISTISVFGALASLSMFSPVSVRAAQEIVIENNGSGSSTEVTVTQETNTTVNQSNNAEITNNVTTEANTGDNQANNNSGDATINTGDVDVNLSVTNQANSSTADLNCCNGGNQGGNITVSGNGPHSQNTVNASSNVTNTVTVTNNANISNNVHGKAITGKNQSSFNNGNVAIKTGNITVNEEITNGPINISSITLSQQSLGKYSITIKDNGYNSENTINLENNIENNVEEVNNFTVVNDSFWELVSGQNFANGNLGDVVIETGDIIYDSKITNKGNINDVEITCCDKKPDKPEKPEKPEEPKVPPTNPQNGNGGDGKGGNGHGVSAGIGGDVLPVTGGSFLFLFLLVSTLFLLFGLFMRLRAGRSPSFALAI